MLLLIVVSLHPRSLEEKQFVAAVWFDWCKTTLNLQVIHHIICQLLLVKVCLGFLKHANEVTFNMLECSVKPQTGISAFPVPVQKQEMLFCLFSHKGNAILLTYGFRKSITHFARLLTGIGRSY